jgi:8-oxo-dGTP diphosphatase
MVSGLSTEFRDRELDFTEEWISGYQGSMPSRDDSRQGSRVRVVAGAVLRGNKVLIARREPGGPRGLLWELPGGKVDPEEGDAQALIRELQEELGIAVAITGLLGHSDYDYPDLSIRLVGLCCRLISGTPVARVHAELRWVRAEELGALDWAPADVPLLESLSALLSSA